MFKRISPFTDIEQLERADQRKRRNRRGKVGYIHQVLAGWKTFQLEGEQTGYTWFVLTNELRDELEAAFSLWEKCKLSGRKTIKMEIATCKDGEGTGKYDTVRLLQAAVFLERTVKFK